MSAIRQCGQMLDDNMRCPCFASYRYTWPGRAEAYICGECVGQLRRIAAAMGLPLQIVDMYPDTKASP